MALSRTRMAQLVRNDGGYLQLTSDCVVNAWAAS